MTTCPKASPVLCEVHEEACLKALTWLALGGARAGLMRPDVFESMFLRMFFALRGCKSDPSMCEVKP